jgi:outer membrane protein OmpA-like peptidoglycan-associated protein
MKKNIALIFTLGVFFLMSQGSLRAQIENPIKKAKRKMEERINEKTDKGIDKSLDEIEKGISDFFKKNKKLNASSQSKTKQSDQVNLEQKDASNPVQTEQNKTELSLVWAKYDFVPGDVIIFEDNLKDEENGEFPSRWDLLAGNAEVAEYGGEKVIMLRDGHPSIIPYFKDPQEDYLPDIFTIEFDLYYPGSGIFEVHLYDTKNQKSGSPTGYTSINIQYNEMEMAHFKSRLPEENIEKSRWMHISIAYTNGKLKAYMDETRLLNIPRIDFNPKGLTLYTYHANNENLFYVKNIRIAKGGVKYYDRFLQDGKIVSNGIRFDVGKATLRPESMGVLNKIYKLMNEHPEVNFSIEGHTDSDGNFDFNQKLSEERAKTVMDQLISMGIDAERLSSKGFGESKPVNTNDTPEGKAANRRVEFCKK